MGNSTFALCSALLYVAYSQEDYWSDSTHLEKSLDFVGGGESNFLEHKFWQDILDEIFF